MKMRSAYNAVALRKCYALKAKQGLAGFRSKGTPFKRKMMSSNQEYGTTCFSHYFLK